jgi:hypothetical protein
LAIRIRSLLIACALVLVLAGAASASWGGRDPVRNTPLGTLPYSCTTAPTAKECIDAGVYYLDKARRRNGLPPYRLPADFPALSEAQQIFILVNLDRIAYGLRPFPGLTAELNHDALVSGVWVADDPHLSNTTGVNTWWPGWAGAFYNAPMAYEAWVWNDGLGANNPRCTPTDHSRCWGHRHSVLWRYGPALAMGAAAGRDLRHHQRGYTYLFVGGSSSYTPHYVYTWKQAVADGAGKNTYDFGTPPPRMCHVPILIGMRGSPAARAITKGHCTVGTVKRRHMNYMAGIVVAQRPQWGRTFAPGSKVGLLVSLGPG